MSPQRNSTEILYSTRPRADRHRWLISYADFVTLLLAVFVVLFAAERHGSDTARQLSQAVQAALTPGSLKRPAVAPPAVPNPQPVPAESKTLADLTTQLRREIAEGTVTVRSEPRGITVSLEQALLYRPGHAEISRSTYPIVDKLAGIVAGVRNEVRLEGHTDNLPIRNSRFRSNWELSAARSIAMLELLVDRYGISRDRLSAAAFAGNNPVGDNESQEGRAKNRRVDVVILGAK